MHYLDFFDEISTITLYDPLSEFLGAFEKGLITFSYLDCVKMAGHSCPTVAGAYLMAQEGLKALYQGSTPTRGDIEVAFKEAKDEGVTGVMASVMTLVMGAGDEGGFKGLSGKYARNHRLHFSTPIHASVKLTRKDTQKSVLMRYDPSSIAMDPTMMKLMQACLSQIALPKEHEDFVRLWQGRVKTILTHSSEVLRLELC